MGNAGKKQNIIIVAISVVIIVAIYVLFQIVTFFRQPTDTVLIKNGELIQYEEVIRLCDS